MKRILLSFVPALILSMQFSCTGVKNVSGTLTKSGSGRHRDYARGTATDYSKVAVSSANSDTVRSAVSQGGVPTEDKALQKELGSITPSDGYRKDYGRIAGVSSDHTQSTPMTFSSQDAKDKLLGQYTDMDRLADLVVYELDILERQWDQLLSKFKTASSSDREKISADLDQLSADQLRLYKAHVKIYRDSKGDWDKTKKDVESTLFSIRGVGAK